MSSDGTDTVKETILLVEDEPEVANLTAKTLCRLGYKLAGWAATGQEAILEAKRNLPSLVLMDIGLPGEMDGVETARRLNQNFNIPIIFVTAANDCQTLARAKKTGPFGYIVKPFDSMSLYIAIEIALSTHRITEQRLKQANELVEKKYRELAAVAFFQIGASGEILQANDALANLLGYESPQDLTSSVRSVKQVFKLDIKDSHQLTSTAPDHPVHIKNLKLNAYRKDGSTVWVSGNIRIIRDGVGDVRIHDGTIGSAAIQQAARNRLRLTAAVNSPALNLQTFSKSITYGSAWMAKTAGETTFLWNDSGEPSNMSTCICTLMARWMKPKNV